MRNLSVVMGLWNCVLLLLSAACTNTGESRQQDNPTAIEIINRSLLAIGEQADRDSIHNIMAIAACISPKGKYSTAMHSASNGYSYFKQVYTFNPQPFEAFIENKVNGFQITDPVKRLDKETVYTIRSHEFQCMALEIDKRFHDLEKPVLVKPGKNKMYSIMAKDELEHSCSLYFDKESGLLSEIHLQNPGNEKEILVTKLSGWKKQQGVQLPYRVEIYQGKEMFLFEYRQIDINSPLFKQQ